MGSDNAESFVRLERLTHAYRQGACRHRVLEELNGEILRGEAVALLGRSGCGKSTLLNLIGGIDTPTAGSVVINGVNITTLGERARTLFRRRHIGFIYQFFNLIPTLTVEENLLLPLELNDWVPAKGRERVRALLEAVSLSDQAESFPDQLAGGEQQRVAIARALVHCPDLVLADEPTGNLDAENGQQILDLLDRLVRDERRTLLVVTHSRAVASQADRVLTLEQGRLRKANEGLLW